MRANDYPQISRTYVQIDMDAIAENVINMKKNIASHLQLILVIKTNGYGHGAVPIAKHFEKTDCVWGYAVATAEEAIELREAGISKPILILGYTFEYSYKDLIKYDIRPAVFKTEMLNKLDLYAKELGKKCKVHVKVDTGMGRIGIQPDETGLQFIDSLLKYENIEFEGIFTHLARADETDKTSALHQISVFKKFVSEIEAKENIKIPFKHCENSAGILEIQEPNMDLVRAGITLYGLWPSEQVSKEPVKLHAALSWYSHIAYIKTVPENTPISYGGTYVTKKQTKIATIPIGYGDGYPRGLSGKGYVLIRGKKAYILGRVCMDQFMVDVSEIENVSEGDIVTLIGTDGNETITMEQLGDLSGRFNYELACNIGRRVPRVYLSNGNIEDILLDTKSIK